MKRRILPTLLLLALTASPARAGNEGPKILLDTAVREQFYDVRGSDADEIFRSIARRGLGNQPGLSASGLTESRTSFRVSATVGEDGCRLEEVELDVEITVTLPRHAHLFSLDPTTRTLWEAYAAQVEFHEYRHVEIEYRGIEEIEAAIASQMGEIPGKGIDHCSRAVRQKIRETAPRTRRRHEAFHESEARDLKKRRRALLDEVAVIDRELDGLRAAVRRLDEQWKSNARAQQRAARNGDLQEFERLAAEVEGLVEARHIAIAESEILLGEREGIGQRLSWVR
jgi:predicted secreted Zn-dependent protease